ncbi:hypothetical protein GZ77_25180 [Endozoicomonas montiporae]|uniref:Uncharacterized protein n=2 Tax=Endozoicomonas montiporae TaxID=1027273 RepID=A0A081MYY3_9GAMM|nr:hypothetical protein [Endozoicomonas montiporae]AMO54873.1 hypothetical protein EZMO1_0633 [Endozoicomonas montiporae CL-33]KEQ11406.1 hypothetical protein GZ77_25180 [Endozoicomonas montiporae]
MKAIKQVISINVLTVMLLATATGNQVRAAEALLSGSVAESIVQSDRPVNREKKTVLERLNQLKRPSIREEFQNVADIKTEMMQFFAYFSAMTNAFYRRLELMGVDRFTGKDDVWRAYYGVGAAAHTLFPEYFRLKREVMRQEMNLDQDDIQYSDLTLDYREKDEQFQQRVSLHRKEGMNPDNTSKWDNSTLKALRAGVLKLDREASSAFSKEFLGGLYETDFRVVKALTDAIIRQEDRIWLFHELGVSDCLTEGVCIKSSKQFFKVSAKLSQLKDDPVLNHYFPQLKNLYCEPATRTCEPLGLINVLDAVKSGMEDDQAHLRSLAIGAFHRFDWKGSGAQVPVTRMLAGLDNEALKKAYLGLLRDRVFWRYIENEHTLNE